jgi:hypothetical protein
MLEIVRAMLIGMDGASSGVCGRGGMGLDTAIILSCDLSASHFPADDDDPPLHSWVMDGISVGEGSSC